MKNFAVLVGITYNSDHKNKLLGTINDVIMFRKYLIEERNYKDEDIIILRDDNPNFLKPTKSNILNSLNKTFKLANMNNSNEIFFYFAGNGNNNKSSSNYNALYTFDNQIIEDNDIRFLLESFNTKTNFICVLDCLNPTNNLSLAYGYVNRNNQLNCVINNSTKDIELIEKRIFLVSGIRDDNTPGAVQPYNVNYDINTDFTISVKNRYGGVFTSSFLKYASENKSFEDIIELLQKNSKDRNLNSNPILYSSLLINVSDLNKVLDTTKLKPPKLQHVEHHNQIPDNHISNQQLLNQQLLNQQLLNNKIPLKPAPKPPLKPAPKKPQKAKNNKKPNAIKIVKKK